MQPIKDLLNSSVPKKGSERAGVIKFFVENLWDKNIKHYPAKRIAIALAHLKLNDLYYFQSVCKDVMARRGAEAMNKYFWWSIRK